MKIINAPRIPTLQVHVYRETNFFFIILIFYVSSELLSHECLLHNHFVFYMSYFAAFVAFPNILPFVYIIMIFSWKELFLNKRDQRTHYLTFKIDQ